MHDKMTLKHEVNRTILMRHQRSEPHTHRRTDPHYFCRAQK